MEKKQYNTPSMQRDARNRNLRTGLIVAGSALAIIGASYFLSKDYSPNGGSSDGNATVIINGDVINSNVNGIHLEEGSELDIDGTYHIGNQIGVDCSKKPYHAPSVPSKKPAPAKRPVSTPDSTKTEEPVVESIDDCVNGADLFENSTLIRGVQKSVDENRQYNTNYAKNN